MLGQCWVRAKGERMCGTKEHGGRAMQKREDRRSEAIQETEGYNFKRYYSRVRVGCSYETNFVLAHYAL